MITWYSSLCTYVTLSIYFTALEWPINQPHWILPKDKLLLNAGTLKQWENKIFQRLLQFKLIRSSERSAMTHFTLFTCFGVHFPFSGSLWGSCSLAVDGGWRLMNCGLCVTPACPLCRPTSTSQVSPTTACMKQSILPTPFFLFRFHQCPFFSVF